MEANKGEGDKALAAPHASKGSHITTWHAKQMYIYACKKKLYTKLT